MCTRRSDVDRPTFFCFLIPSSSTYSSSCHKKPTPTDVTRRSGVKPRCRADSYLRVEQRDETEHVTNAAIFLHRPTGCVLRRERLDRRRAVRGVSAFIPPPPPRVCVHVYMLTADASELLASFMYLPAPPQSFQSPTRASQRNKWQRIYSGEAADLLRASLRGVCGTRPLAL